MSNKQLIEMNIKLDKIIKLLAMNLIKDEKYQKDKIISLSKLNLQPIEIAEILGTTANTVSVTLYDARKAGLI